MRFSEYLTEAKQQWIDAARNVVKNKQYVYINVKTNEFSNDDEYKKKKGWVLLDLFTASAMVQIYDALKDKANKEKYGNMNIAQAVDITWKLVGK